MSHSKSLLSFVLFMFCTLLTSQNPTVVNGVATYSADINIGRKFPVPDSWNKILIKENVTITGSFYMGNRSKPIEIAGESRETSIIQGDGSRPTDDGIKGRTYSAIRCDGSPDLYVHDLKITKPMKFHIHGGFGNVTVERCNIIAGTHTYTTDGIHGGKGKTVIKDCYIDVYDDALYTSECKLVENTTIRHNKNGGPFMTSWGGDVPNNHVCVIRNCTVIANYNGSDYNHGVVSWAGKNASGSETITLKFEGTFKYEIAPGASPSPFYTIGRPGKTGLNNAHIVVDGICPMKSSIDLRGSTNCSVTFKNCIECTDKTAPSIPGKPDTSTVTFNAVNLSWEPSTDNEEVAGYDVYANNKRLTFSAKTSVLLSGLTCETLYDISVVAVDACGNMSEKSAAVSFYTKKCPPCTAIPTLSGGNGPEMDQTPYKTMILPCTILAEDIDDGDNGVAYYDNGYAGNVTTERPLWSTEHGFRTDSDVEYDQANDNTFVGGINPGEWGEYTVSVTDKKTFRLASVTYFTNSGNSARIYFKMDDNISCLYDLPDTKGQITTLPINDFEFTLSEGEHIFAWVSEASKFNLESFAIEMALGSGINKSNSDVNIYPNPFYSQIKIKTNSRKIQLYNLFGQKMDVETNFLDGDVTLSAGHLSPGNYILMIDNEVRFITKIK